MKKMILYVIRDGVRPGKIVWFMFFWKERNYEKSYVTICYVLLCCFSC